MTQAASAYLEPAAACWRELATYTEVLERDYLAPLQQAARATGQVAPELQVDVVRRLHWYFTVDRRERAPTVRLSVAAAPAFHALIGEILRHVDPELMASLEDEALGEEVRQVLYSWHGQPGCSLATVAAFDHAQGLVQLRYYVHGEAPAEQWFIDGQPVQPAYAKYRGCRYFHRTCLQQRIVWLPVTGSGRLSLQLAGRAHPLALDLPAGAPLVVRTVDGAADGALDVRGAAWPLSLDLAAAAAAYWPGRGGRRLPRPWNLARFKAWLLVALSRLPWIRRRFRDAWVFMDRDINADDNAEHLYRWVRQHHPEINAWFLLQADVPDWARLSGEGFRLMPPGLMRKLLVLNSRHIISSHAEYMDGGLDRAVYAPWLRWCFSFVSHGISKDDVSTWLGPLSFDLFVCCSPGEAEAIAASGTNYPYTWREVQLLGLPRQDRLLRLSLRNASSPGHGAAGLPDSAGRTLVIMPTWRGGDFEEQARQLPAAERHTLFSQTAYARAWRTLLRQSALPALAASHGWRLVFMAHANILDYLAALEIPPTVEIVSMREPRVQATLIEASALLTDYTSVAFEMALLRRPSFYYQFDFADFYGGGHNWRPGYFDYQRDGFGPVAFSEAELLAQLGNFFARGLEPHYLARMQRAMPLDDGLACARTFAAIQALERPWGLSSG